MRIDAASNLYTINVSRQLCKEHVGFAKCYEEPTPDYGRANGVGWDFPAAATGHLGGPGEGRGGGPGTLVVNMRRCVSAARRAVGCGGLHAVQSHAATVF